VIWPVLSAAHRGPEEQAPTDPIPAASNPFGPLAYHAPGQTVLPTSLSGQWKGSYSILQRGRCTVGRFARSDHPIEVSIAATAEGSIHARVVSDRKSTGSSPATAEWSGSVGADDSTITFLVPGRATCEDTPREYQIAVSGTVRAKKGVLQLQLEGDDQPCPNMGCTFKRVYKLSQK
jgi:hypothetical protein